MEEQLKTIFSNVNDWLKFAEAKNGVLTGFNGGAVFTVMTSFLFNKDMTIMNNYFVKAYFICFAICAALGLIIALMSFIAKLEIPGLMKTETRSSDNLMFFGAICKYNEKTYLTALANALLLENKESYTKWKNFMQTKSLLIPGLQ